MSISDQIAACDRMQERAEQRREVEDWSKREDAWLIEQAQQIVDGYDELLSEVA